MSEPDRSLESAPTLLVDRKRLLDEYGLRRNDADRVFKRLPVIYLGDRSDKVYVRRDQLEELLASCTFAKDQIRKTG